MALFPIPHFPTSHSQSSIYSGKYTGCLPRLSIIYDDNDKVVRNTSWDNIPADTCSRDTRVLGDNTAPVDRNGDNVLARRPAE